MGRLAKRCLPCRQKNRKCLGTKSDCERSPQQLGQSRSANINISINQSPTLSRNPVSRRKSSSSVPTSNVGQLLHSQTKQHNHFNPFKPQFPFSQMPNGGNSLNFMGPAKTSNLKGNMGPKANYLSQLHSVSFPDYSTLSSGLNSFDDFTSQRISDDDILNMIGNGRTNNNSFGYKAEPHSDILNGSRLANLDLHLPSRSTNQNNYNCHNLQETVGTSVTPDEGLWELELNSLNMDQMIISCNSADNNNANYSANNNLNNSSTMNNNDNTSASNDSIFNSCLNLEGLNSSNYVTDNTGNLKDSRNNNSNIASNLSMSTSSINNNNQPLLFTARHQLQNTNDDFGMDNFKLELGDDALQQLLTRDDFFKDFFSSSTMPTISTPNTQSNALHNLVGKSLSPSSLSFVHPSK
eukprot:Awhi_evm1s1414